MMHSQKNIKLLPVLFYLVSSEYAQFREAIIVIY